MFLKEYKPIYNRFGRKRKHVFEIKRQLKRKLSKVVSLLRTRQDKNTKVSFVNGTQ